MTCEIPPLNEPDTNDDPFLLLPIDFHEIGADNPPDPEDD